MSSWELANPHLSGGQPATSRIGDAVPRRRSVFVGVISQVTTVTVGGTRSCLITIRDRSGTLGLLFLGRPAVPGMVAGALCSAEGTIICDGDRLVIWNPLYCLEEPEMSGPDRQEDSVPGSQTEDWYSTVCRPSALNENSG